MQAEIEKLKMQLDYFESEKTMLSAHQKQQEDSKMNNKPRKGLKTDSAMTHEERRLAIMKNKSQKLIDQSRKL